MRSSIRWVYRNSRIFPTSSSRHSGQYNDGSPTGLPGLGMSASRGRLPPPGERTVSEAAVEPAWLVLCRGWRPKRGLEHRPGQWSPKAVYLRQKKNPDRLVRRDLLRRPLRLRRPDVRAGRGIVSPRLPSRVEVPSLTTQRGSGVSSWPAYTVSRGDPIRSILCAIFAVWKLNLHLAWWLATTENVK